MASTAPVLVAEDDPALSTVIELTLRGASRDVVTVRTGGQALRELETKPFDLVVLDLMLPDVHGLEVCRWIRARSQVPVIITTALDATADVVAGLEAGADDYITKPFEAPELLARIRAVQRRTSAPEDGTRRVAELEIDPGAFVVRKAGRELDLSVTEFRVLDELSSHLGNVLSREQLMERVWNYDYLGDSRVVDMAVKRLRSKIEDDPRQPRHVVTVRGVGYRMPRR